MANNKKNDNKKMLSIVKTPKNGCQIEWVTFSDIGSLIGENIGVLAIGETIMVFSRDSNLPYNQANQKPTFVLVDENKRLTFFFGTIVILGCSIQESDKSSIKFKSRGLNTTEIFNAYDFYNQSIYIDKIDRYEENENVLVSVLSAYGNNCYLINKNHEVDSVGFIVYKILAKNNVDTHSIREIFRGEYYDDYYGECNDGYYDL